MSTGKDFSLAGITYPVERVLHAENRERLVARMKAHGADRGVIFLSGGVEETRDDTDDLSVFRQESFFHWAFGVHLSGWHGAIVLETGETRLYMPRLPESFATWMGPIESPEYFQEEFGVPVVRYDDEMVEDLRHLSPKSLYLLSGMNTDSGTPFPTPTHDWLRDFPVDLGTLFEHIVECRVIKSERELQLMRHVNKISSNAHIKVMQAMRPGLGEFQAESLFQHETYFRGGCRNVSYTCISASGCNSSVLHYGAANAPNSKQIVNGDMCLFDMGGEYYCYASDITCSFPANGTFTERQKNIYNIVLQSQRNVMAVLREGVNWKDMHLLAHKTIIEGFLKLGLLNSNGCTADEMVEKGLGTVFMPHGLGHLMGKDTHDVGGYAQGAKRSDKPYLKSLRLGRTLLAGMVVTVEPGVYFIPDMIKNALNNPDQAPHLNMEALKAYEGFGGIRLEDDVIILKDGMENMTMCPRTVEEVEACMRGKYTSPLEDTA